MRSAITLALAAALLGTAPVYAATRFSHEDWGKVLANPALFPVRNDQLAYYLNAYNAEVFKGVSARTSRWTARRPI